MAAERVHLCFVAPFAWPVLARDAKLGVIGGAEVQQTILARALVRAGHRVSMISLDFGQPERVEVDGVTVHKAYRPEAGVAGLRFLHPRITGMWRAMREVDADVYYQRSSAMLTAVVAEFSRLYGKRSIYAGAADADFLPGRQQIRYRRDRWLFERGLARVDRLVVQNRSQQKNCLLNYGRHSVLIPSCYELPADARPEPGDTILWVGTVHQYKRPELLIELARRLPHRRFVMIGGAGCDEAQSVAYYEGIRAAAAALPNVEFKGFLPLDQVEPYFDRARVHVNTSAAEGVPNTFLQAWARGVPTVAWVDIGASYDGEPLYPVVGSLEQAAAEIERLFADPARHRREGERSRAYFGATHSPREALARYNALLRELAERPRAAA
jgi:glycosyltransferase involved in cell wall biosynthesis